MSKNNPNRLQQLEAHLQFLGLPFMVEHHENLARQAATDHWTHLQYLDCLAQGEVGARHDRAIKRRIRLARLPVIKTIEQFQWSWPKKINQVSVQNLFRLKFVEDKANVIFLGGVGLGKTHLATALAYAACLQGKSVLFTTAIDAINTLSAAHAANRLKTELKKYLTPAILLLDELGYLPIVQNLRNW
jgi:DNA replication protein DnaC